MITAAAWIGSGLAAFWAARRLHARLLLSRAKHPSLRGHARLSLRLSRWLPFYEFGDEAWFGADAAPADVQQKRRHGFAQLSAHFAAKAPRTLAASRALEASIADVEFVNHYRVPFPFRAKVRRELPIGSMTAASGERQLQDLDGNWSLDLTGGYGVNLFGHEFYKGTIARGVARAEALGPVLGSYHPVIADVTARLQRLSGLDQVSFHMSGTEAVMQAVRLARYHTRRSHVVRFCGAYHGWWDGVQAGVGNPRPAREIYTLADLSERSLDVLRTRSDIACVLVNPLQAMHPNGNAPSDSMLMNSGRKIHYDKESYTRWLRRLREVCSARGIVLVFDEVFLGFRLAPGGAQEYFGVRADLVTYGKTLGGGLPIGVVCGKADLMRRFHDDRPTDICFARGTFNSHPYVLTAAHEFLLALDQPEVLATYENLDARWDGRANRLNERLAAAGLPVRVANMVSIWATVFTQPCRYAWMFQFYLRAQGIAMSWVGSGRFIFSHDFTDADCDRFADRFVAAAEAMVRDGWWWQGPHLTDRWIRQRLWRELVAAWRGRRRIGAAPEGTAVSEPAPAPAAARVATSGE